MIIYLLKISSLNCIIGPYTAKIEPIINAAKTIKSHWTDVINYAETKISNRVLEGINGMVPACIIIYLNYLKQKGTLKYDPDLLMPSTIDCFDEFRFSIFNLLFSRSPNWIFIDLYN